MAYELPVPSFSRLDKADLRTAGRELLSLALMDARNHTLFLIGEYQKAMEGQGVDFPCLPELNPPLWELGHVGWFQERWIGRNLQRHQGQRADPQATPLASVQPQADFWWDSSRMPHDRRWSLSLPPLADIKAYLLTTLESTLELLAKTPDEDDALYFYRLALFHEDMHGEAFIYMAQTLGLRLKLPLPAPGLVREPLWLPATRWRLGLNAGQGYTFDNERPAHEVAVPEFEIDAQPVSWTQYVEFVADGGYDRPELWLPAGWEWLQQQAQGDEGRRAPRHVEQIGLARARGQGGVLQRWFGNTVRVAGWSPVMHLSWWEADAWCRWAGRRLPSEVEWEVAAHQAANRGFRWGDVWEWTGTTFQGYPGFQADPYRDYSEPWFGTHKVLRGASLATRRRMKSPKYRNYFLPGRDDIFCGFRSCAL
ncbi:MAG: selenoneine synthase SenA [Hylemonella sp.]|uniref:selenoneine synthase SenA n=1 Tax=Hylemonella sp. TaxID=2066020 RepID=UPI0022C8ED0E|nr:selenoneine synthase SenA [Hylemonella sp.]MCZ8250940.1 selenoneine synthase SenA [Hylemonella sp.]